MHVVAAQAQVAVQLEDLHAPSALLGVTAQRFEVAGPVLFFGRLFGGAFFLFRARTGAGGGCMPPGPPKPPGAICAKAGGANASGAS